MNLFSGPLMMRTTSTKLPVKTAVGLLVAGGLLLAGIGWSGLEHVAPASTAVEHLGPVMPFLPLTAIHLLNLLP
jgi:hypothetical protein